MKSDEIRRKNLKNKIDVSLEVRYYQNKNEFIV